MTQTTPFLATAVAIALSTLAASEASAEVVGRFCPAKGHCAQPTDSEGFTSRPLVPGGDLRFNLGSSGLVAVADQAPELVPPTWQSAGRPARFSVDPSAQQSGFSAPSGRTVLLFVLSAALLLLLTATYRMFRTAPSGSAAPATAGTSPETLLLAPFAARTVERSDETLSSASADSVAHPAAAEPTNEWAQLVALCGGNPVRAATVIAGECAVDPLVDAGSALAISRALRRFETIANGEIGQ